MSDGGGRYCGRDFSAEQIQWIRKISARREPKWNRRAISRAVCEHLDWRKPDGGLKDMSARVALLRMHREGRIELPPPSQKVPARIDLTQLAQTDPPSALIALPRSLDEVRPLQFQIIRSGPHSQTWNSFVERYHYLGYSALPGAQMRYMVRSACGEPLALLGFGAAAWKTAPRDSFIGWSAALREQNLPYVANNARFLILPWIQIPNLASHILAHCEKRLPDDWQQRYSIRPVLLESFCEIPRFSGTCYQAANWTRVGQTQGRGKLDVHKKYALPIKDIWLKPLHRHWKAVLNSQPDSSVG